ncbi:acyltransferase family protein [Rubritalea spongiae]|uniref:Acyltransferase family protein n=1 Tax=Rubritalea spongiae TaxID=430797 RepID=A0ABW5E6E1_9BACT
MNQTTNDASKWNAFLSRFSRVTSSGSYLPEIDGLRFIAIMAVVLYHAHLFFFANPIPNWPHFPVSWDWLNFAIGQGWFGVQVFFVISGFVLALPFAGHFLEGKKPVDLKTYYSRRVVRIGLPYCIALTLGLLFALGGDLSLTDAFQRYAAGLLYSHGIFYDGALNPILFVSWTLEIEIQFYLLAPLLCTVFKVKNLAARTAILTAGIFLVQRISGELNHHHSSPLWSHSIIGQLQFFLAGLMLGDFYISLWKDKTRKLTWLWDSIGALSWLAIPLALKLPTLQSWLALLLLLAFTCVLRGNLLRKLLSLSLVSTIGGMCYSIYLFHGAILYSLFYHLITPIFGNSKGSWPYNLLPLAVLTALTIIGCLLPYYFIERPTMLWRGKKK